MSKHRRQLFCPVSVDDIEHVAVVLGQPSRYMHTGIAYRSDQDNVHLLELRFHLLVGNEEMPSAAYVWAIPRIRREHAEQISMLCQLVGEIQPEVPYAFDYLPSSFSFQDGTLLLKDGCIGLTCATFVLAIFFSAGIRLVEGDTWPEREEDAQWHQEIQDYMVANAERFNFSPDHMAENAMSVGCVRYRPEEVAGACLSPEHPVHFNRCEPLGRKALRVFRDFQNRESASLRDPLDESSR